MMILPVDLRMGAPGLSDRLSGAMVLGGSQYPYKESDALDLCSPA